MEPRVSHWVLDLCEEILRSLNTASNFSNLYMSMINPLQLEAARQGVPLLLLPLLHGAVSIFIVYVYAAKP